MELPKATKIYKVFKHNVVKEINQMFIIFNKNKAIVCISSAKILF